MIHSQLQRPVGGAAVAIAEIERVASGSGDADGPFDVIAAQVYIVNETGARVAGVNIGNNGPDQDCVLRFVKGRGCALRCGAGRVGISRVAAAVGSAHAIEVSGRRGKAGVVIARGIAARRCHSGNLCEARYVRGPLDSIVGFVVGVISPCEIDLAGRDRGGG